MPTSPRSSASERGDVRHVRILIESFGFGSRLAAYGTHIISVGVIAIDLWVAWLAALRSGSSVTVSTVEGP